MYTAVFLRHGVYVCAGGNSKTAMIAAVSPADINYEETLSTLRSAVMLVHCTVTFGTVQLYQPLNGQCSIHVAAASESLCYDAALYA